jgi:hypothetical protein
MLWLDVLQGIPTMVGQAAAVQGRTAEVASELQSPGHRHIEIIDQIAGCRADRIGREEAKVEAR